MCLLVCLHDLAAALPLPRETSHEDPGRKQTPSHFQAVLARLLLHQNRHAAPFAQADFNPQELMACQAAEG